MIGEEMDGNWICVFLGFGEGFGRAVRFFLGFLGRGEGVVEFITEAWRKEYVGDGGYGGE